MKANEGTIDRAIRITLGVAILSLLAVGPVPGWGLVALVGILPLTTGLAAFCPIYVPLGLDTRGSRHAARHVEG